jgi:hypothetical protein
MTYQIQYNTKTSQAILQSLILLLDNVELTYEKFAEVSELSQRTYNEILHDLANLIKKINLGELHKYTYDVIARGTSYKTYSYKLLTCDTQDFDYYNLSDEERIKYSLCIVYLKLINHDYVSYDSLAKILPDFKRKTCFYTIEKLKEIVSEDLYKDEFQSYVIEDFDE